MNVKEWTVLGLLTESASTKMLLISFIRNDYIWSRDVYLLDILFQDCVCVLSVFCYLTTRLCFTIMQINSVTFKINVKCSKLIFIMKWKGYLCSPQMKLICPTIVCFRIHQWFASWWLFFFTFPLLLTVFCHYYWL
jgi:hypothetical protein